MTNWKGPRHIGVVVRHPLVHEQHSFKDIAFAVEACAFQLRELAIAYDEPAWTIAYYDSLDQIDAQRVHPIYLDDTSGEAHSAAIHYAVGELPGGQVDATDNPDWTVHLSHEALEIGGNPLVNSWMDPAPGQTWLIAHEVSDPVQDESYELPVTLIGTTQKVRVSNYVLPTWWIDDPYGPWDRMGTRTRDHEISAGGYLIERNGLEKRFRYADGEIESAPGGRVRGQSRGAMILRA